MLPFAPPPLSPLATQATLPTNPTPCPWLPNFKIQTKCKRPVSSAFYMLKIGHGYLKTYLKRIGKTASDQCRCGAQETADHLLLSCKEYSYIRPERLKASRPISQILGQKEGLLDILQFICKTQIPTRQWHLDRHLEEDPEDT